MTKIICPVLGCSSRKGGNKTFHRFPVVKDVLRCLKWVVFTRSDALKQQFLNRPKRLYDCHICGEHFADCCFMNPDRTRLVHDAVPTLYKINPANDGITSRRGRKPDKAIGTGGGYKLLDENVLKEMMLELSKELEHILHETWSGNNYQVDTLVVVPHYHGSLPSLPSLLAFDAVIADLPHRPLLSPILTDAGVRMPQDPTPQPADRSARELTVMTHRAFMDHPSLPCSNTSSELRVAKPSTLTTPRKRTCGVERMNNLLGGQRIKNEISCTGSENNDVRLKLPVKDLRDNVDFKEEPVDSGVCSYYICCVHGCTSTNKTCKLYPFPANSQQAMTWVERSSRQDLLPFLNLNGAVPNNFLLCRRHFHDDQFVIRGDREVLKKLAFPTLFPSICYEEEKLQHQKMMDPLPGVWSYPRAPAQYEPQEARMAGMAALCIHDSSRNRKRWCESCSHSKCEFLKKLHEVSTRRHSKFTVRKRSTSFTKKCWHSPQPFDDQQEGQTTGSKTISSHNVNSKSDVKYNGLSANHRLLRKHLQKNVTAADMQSINELDEEIEHLKNELHLLCTATSHRHRAYVYDLKREPVRIAACKAQFGQDNDKAALARLRPRLTEATYQLMKQQLTSVSYPRWNGSVEATRLPLIISTVGLKVYGVLRKLYALPSLAHVCGYRVKARRNPYLYGQYMSEFVKKQHRSRHHPAVRRYFGAMRKINRPSVAKVLEMYVKMGDRLSEPTSEGVDRKQ